MVDFTALMVVIGALMATGLPIAILLNYYDVLGDILPFLKKFLPFD